MRILISILAQVMLSGCAGAKWKVVGKSGNIYQAPDPCQALVACLDAKETSCYYATWKDPSGYQSDCQATENK